MAKIFPIHHLDWRFSEKTQRLLLGLLMIAVSLLLGCGGKSAQQNIQPREDEIVAVITNPDGSKTLDVIVRAIEIKAKYDSAKRKYTVTTDTIFGKYYFKPMIDSVTKNPIIDSITKQPKLTKERGVILFHKDSVNWRVEGRPLTELLKRDTIK